jgi:hypothetical protein
MIQGILYHFQLKEQFLLSGSSDVATKIDFSGKPGLSYSTENTA